jgi:hypothetical protein
MQAIWLSTAKIKKFKKPAPARSICNLFATPYGEPGPYKPTMIKSIMPSILLGAAIFAIVYIASYDIEASATFGIIVAVGHFIAVELAINKSTSRWK